MANEALRRAIEIRDKVIEFNVFLHHTDGDSHEARTVAGPLTEAMSRLSAQIDHLNAVPFQPDR